MKGIPLEQALDYIEKNKLNDMDGFKVSYNPELKPATIEKLIRLRKKLKAFRLHKKVIEK